MDTGQRQQCLSLVLAILLALCCASCTRHKTTSILLDQQKASIPRIDPGYIQWLERQSMLGSTRELTSQVSGSERLWQGTGPQQKIDLLLQTAPNWIVINPHLVASPASRVFAHIATSPLIEHLESLGINGLFLAPTGERSDVWTDSGNAKAISPLGGNVAALRFDEHLGAEKDFEQLARRLDERHIQLGGTIVPAATGIGPDFMLQARGATRFEGMYAMLSVPREHWRLLPACKDTWDCQTLAEADLQRLRDADVLPQNIMRDKASWASPGGWAVTGEVHGVDGKVRRWIYRHAGNAFCPVLLWQDPSGQARRVASASVIRHTGLQQQTLAGLSMEALLGLEAGEGEAALASGFNAIEQLGLEVHRYGGWSLHADPLPPEMWAKTLSAGLDFTADEASTQATLQAIGTADTTQLAILLTNTMRLKIPQKRLVRGLQDFTATNPTTLASQIASILSSANGTNSTASIHAACRMLLEIRAALPGLCMISLQDLTGTPNLDPLPLWEAQNTTLPFEAIAKQWADRQSLLHHIGLLLQARRKHGLATGTLERVEHNNKGCIAFASALPGGGYWLTVANFSAARQAFAVPLPAKSSRECLREILGGNTIPCAGTTLQLDLKGRESRHFLLNTH